MSRRRLNEGLVQVYFGRGKGKTTAAIGQAIRATGHGFKVYMIQFMKGNYKYGEVSAIKEIPNFELKQFGSTELIAEPGEFDKDEGQKAIDFAREIINSDAYDLVILDEVGVAISMNVIAVEPILEIIKNKPEKVELVITGGPKMHPKIKEIADLVTEMKMVKHYYSSQGLTARFGIEF